MKKVKAEFTRKEYEDWVKNINLRFESIGWDFILFDNIRDIPYRTFPTKITYPQIFILAQGKIEIGFDFKRYTFVAPCVFFSGAGRISQYFGTSEDISMPTIVISKQLVKNLQLSYQQLLPLFLFLRDNISIPLNNDELDLLLDHYSLLNKILQSNDSFRIGSARHLVESLILTLGHLAQPHIIKANYKKSRQETIFGEFIGMIPRSYQKSLPKICE